MLLTMRLRADAGQLKAEVVGAGDAIEKFGQKARGAGQQAAGGFDGAQRAVAEIRGAGEQTAGSLGNLASMIPALRAGFAALGVGQVIRQIAMAGDEATQTLARIKNATGDAVIAADVYQRLQRLAGETGVSVAESAGAFTRFQVAARDVGATSDQVVRLVEGITKFGIVSGGSTQEINAAVQQLGQALASGRLQGDELRSVLENMPQLAAALAKELGTSVGGLRQMGSEGQLTADRVFPALLRASQGINEQFERMPPSIGRAFGQLGAEMLNFAANLDKALGLSRAIAAAAQAAAGAVSGVRQAVGLGTPEEQARGAHADATRALAVARQRLSEAERYAGASDYGLDATAQRELGALRIAVGEAIEIEQRAQGELDRITAEGTTARWAESVRAEQVGADARRTRSRTENDELREKHDKQYKIQKEFEDRMRVLQEGRDTGAISLAEFVIGRRQASADRDEDLKKARGEGRGGGARRVDTTERDNLLQQWRELGTEGARLTDQLRTPWEKYNAEVARAKELLDANTISQDTYNRAVERAETAFNTATAGGKAFSDAIGSGGIIASVESLRSEIQGFGKDAAKALADGLTGVSSLEGGFKSFLKQLQSGIAAKLIYDQITKPLTDAVSKIFSSAVGGYQAGGVGGIFNSILNGLFGGAAKAGGKPDAATGAVDFSGGAAKSAVFHAGGIIGGAAPGRVVPMEIFAGARRFHTGGLIGSDEVPIIGRRGEGVFTPEQMRALGPAGSGGMSISIDARGAQAGVESKIRNALIAARPLFAQDAVQAVGHEANRGGTYSRVVGRRR